MRNRRDTIVLVTLVACVVLLALIAGSSNGGGSTWDPRPSTYLNSPHGARALHEVLRRLKQPVARRMEPFAEASPLRGPLAVLAPSLPPSPAEIHALADWVRGGGTLIYAARRGDLTLDSLGLRLRGFAPDTTLAEQRSPGIAALAGTAPVVAGIPPVTGFRRGFVRRGAPLAHATTLAYVGRYPVVVDFRLGKGRVIAWSDALPLVNSRLRASGGAVLFARSALDATQGRRLWFDEYHHGFETGGSVYAGALRFLLRYGWGHVLLQVTVAALGVLLLFGRRFGAPIPPAPPRRRSPLEHVDALAGAYRQAEARDTARRLVLAGLARRMGRRVPRDAAAEGEMLARMAAHPAGAEAARALQAEWKKGQGADLVALSRDVDRYLEEVSRT